MLEIKNLQSETPKLYVDNMKINNHVVVLGPSGAGKTTFLRCIAGMHDYSGDILLKGKPLTSKGPNRKVSIAWQDSRLLPMFSARKNIEIAGNNGLEKYVKLLNAESILDKKPHELSGGEAQRVNIIRALCAPSDIVLFDEPMQGIDPVIVRKTVKKILHELTKQNRIAIFVTHELYQTYAFFDRALIIRNGEKIDFGNFQDLYDNPSSPWMANFFGPYMLLNRKDLADFEHHSNEDPCMVRPEWLKIKMPPFKKPLKTNAVVSGVKWNGPTYRVSLTLDSSKKPLTVEVNTDSIIKKGDKCYVNFKKCSRPSWVFCT